MLTYRLSLLAAAVAFTVHAEDAPKWDVNQPPGLKAEAKLDVRSGTWMGLDVSPDGRTIAFDLLGDLYTLPMAGGEASALTHDIAWQMQPRYSPDGKKIAFVSDLGGGDNVWTMNSDGSDAKAISSESFRLLNNPVWSPDGRYIAARKHFTGTRSLGSGEIWLFHTNGGKGLALNDKPNWQKDLGEPAFSPDGRYLYFSQDTTAGNTFQYNKDSNKQIFEIKRLDRESGDIESFVSGPGGAVRPTPSPDGKYLAFVRRVRFQSTLFLKDLATGAEFPLWDKLERDMQEAWSVHGVYPGFDWTPDSQHIVIWAQGKIWKIARADGRASEIPFHVNSTREVREAVRFPVKVAPDQFDVKQLRWATVSPDGKRVIYSALGYVYSKELPDGTPKRITTQNDHFEFFPSFSRDGKSIVFVSWNDQKLGSVRRIDSNGKNEKVLTTAPGKYAEPRFSPDGKIVVFSKLKGGYLTSPWYGNDPGIYTVDSDGKSTPQRLTKDGSQPQFAANNHELYIVRFDGDGEESSSKLFRLNLRDRSEREIANSEFASEYTVSPDGNYLSFAERFHAYVMPFPRSSKPLSAGRDSDSLPLKKLSVNGGEYVHFSGDSKRVFFSYGEQLFSRDVAEALVSDDKKVAEQAIKIGFTQTTDKPTAVVAFTNAKIVTMKGDQVIDKGNLVISGNRISAVGADAAIPRDATVIDVGGKTIIPGLVDVHWHGGMGEDKIIPQTSWINLASLAFGVTTLHDPSNDTGEIFTQAEMQKAGLVTAPRIFSTGTILYGAKAPFSAAINSLDDALTHLKRLQAAGAISVKSYNQPRREQRQQILEAARQIGMMVVPEGGSLVQHNMTMVVDGHTGIEHSIPVANAYDDIQQLWSQTKVGYTPTLGVAYGGLDGEHYWYAKTDVWLHPLLSKYVPRTLLDARAIRRETAPDSDWNVISNAKTAMQLQRNGVNVNIGAHGQREGLAAHWEMWTLGLGGATPMEALRVATINGAKYLAMDNDIGSIEVGKLADLVVIDGDVLNDIRQSDRITQVMVNGRLYDAATMNEIGATPRPRGALFFEGKNAAYVPTETEVWTRNAGHQDGDAR